MGFLKENWIWIAVPVLLAVAGMVVLYFLGGDASESGGTYPVF